MNVFSLARGDHASLFNRLLFLPFFAVYATASFGQSNEVVTVPKVSYSHLHELPDGTLEKREFDAVTLSETLMRLRFDSQSWSPLGPDTIEILKSDPLTKPLGEGLEQGGMSAAAATVILSVTSIGAEECAKLGMEMYKTPILGRSSMHAIQNSINTANSDGLGRGQFDIRTTKFVLCRDLSSNDVEGVPINVRWVFNINGNSLETTKAPSGGHITGPGGEQYKQNFHAEGLGIQVVLMEINGMALSPGHLVYSIVEDACIDIWFKEEVDGFDISVPASIPNFGVFCAGGYCKNKPPGLDATR